MPTDLIINVLSAVKRRLGRILLANANAPDLKSDANSGMANVSLKEV